MGEGLKRAALAAKRTRYPGTPEVEPRQVWGDVAQAAAQREITVLRFDTKTRLVWRDAVGGVPGHYDHDVPYRVAVCTVKIRGKQRTGTVSIDVARFFPTKNGYRYLRTETT